MRKSKKKTEWLLLKASSNNEYSDCECCVVHIPEGVVDIWKERAVRVQGLVDDTDDLVGVEWMYYDIQFLSKDIEEKDTPYWVTITDADRKKYQLDDKVTGCSMHITSRGTVWFQGYGKHSGDEYTTTDDILISEL